MIKLIATDIDGTILKHNYQFSDNVKSCIKNLIDSGTKVVLVTGRMYAATREIADLLGIETPVVTYQGGLIKYNGETLYEKNVDVKSAKEVIELAKKSNVHLNLYIDDKLYVEKDDEVIRRYIKQGVPDFCVKSFDKINLEDGNINKILLVDFECPEKVTQWHDFLKEKFSNLSIVKSTPFFCEVSHKEATKFHSLDFLINHFDLKREEVLAIGDQNNDLDLLRAGGIKIAMGNATPELKAVADYVTDSVENDGFVKAVEKFVYNKVI